MALDKGDGDCMVTSRDEGCSVTASDVAARELLTEVVTDTEALASSSRSFSKSLLE